MVHRPKEAAELFAALACPTRLQIVCRLRHGEQTVHGLVDCIDSSQPNISCHLRLLRQAGIVRRERSGRQVTVPLEQHAGQRLERRGVCRALSDAHR